MGERGRWQFRGVSASQSDLPAAPEAKPPRTLEEHAQDLPSKLFNPKALPLLVALGVGGILTLGGYGLAQTTISTKVDAGVAPVAAESRALTI